MDFDWPNYVDVNYVVAFSDLELLNVTGAPHSKISTIVFVSDVF